MDNSFKRLRQKVLEAVREQKQLPNSQLPRPQETLFFEYVRLRFSKLGISEENLAQTIDWSLEDIQNLLQDKLDLLSLNDIKLEKLARGLACEVTDLQVMLHGLLTSTSTEHSSKSPAKSFKQ